MQCLTCSDLLLPLSQLGSHPYHTIIYPLDPTRSFCNEPGCNNNDRSAPTEPTLSFKNAVETHDGTRAVTGNMCVNWGTCPKEAQYLDHGNNTNFQMPALLDVQGFSHVHDTVFVDYHKAWPTRPLVASECCSCLTQRGEDDDLLPPSISSTPSAAAMVPSAAPNRYVGSKSAVIGPDPYNIQ
jgi:hypothetical protein